MARPVFARLVVVNSDGVFTVQVALVVAIISAVASLFGAGMTWLVARANANRQDRRSIVERRLQRLQDRYKSLLQCMEDLVDLVRASFASPSEQLRMERLEPFAKAFEEARIDFHLAPDTRDTEV